MKKNIARVALVLTSVVLIASAASAQTITDTTCTAAGGSTINCTSTSTTLPTQAAIMGQNRKDRAEMNKNMQELGRSVGTLVGSAAAKIEQ